MTEARAHADGAAVTPVRAPRPPWAWTNAPALGGADSTASGAVRRRGAPRARAGTANGLTLRDATE